MLRLAFAMFAALWGQAAPALAQTLGLAHERVLVVTHSPKDWPGAGEARAEVTEKLLRHFTPNTETVASDRYESGAVARFTKVVVLGVAYDLPVPEALLADLSATDRTIVWLGFGVGQLTGRSAKFGFDEDDFFESGGEPPSVVYEGKAYPTDLDGYARVHVTRPETRIWSVLRRGTEIAPHALRGANLWFVNSLPNLVWTEGPTIAPTLVFADLLHEVFATGVARRHRAVLRLEDVSTHIPPPRLEAFVSYLEGAKVPFAIGLIPNQRLADGSIEPLAEKLRLVRALRRAQREARATIVLHGFYHTFGTGEDYEFWDEVNDAPLAGEAPEDYACKMERGIAILRDLGLEPLYWETPHYAASEMAYRTFARYFSHAFENRREESWVPYPYGPDRFGQVLIPETIDYIAPSEGRTVERQLERARLLQIVRDAWAVGFAHPAVVPVSELRRMVEGLRGLGYEFEDISAYPVRVASGHRPGRAQRIVTGWSLATRVNLPMFARWASEASASARSVAGAVTAWAGFAASAAAEPAQGCDAVLSRHAVKERRTAPAAP